MGGGLTFQARAENNKCASLLGAFRLKKTPQRWCCSPSGPLYRPPRIAQDWQCTGNIYSSLHGNKTRAPPQTPRTKKRNKNARVGQRILSRVDTHCIQECLCCYHAGCIPYVNARCRSRCQTLRGAVPGNGPPCLGLQQSSSNAHAPDSMLLKVYYK